MSEDIKQLTVKELLSGSGDYLIPMYQRNYAWDEAEITQLIQDVMDDLPKGRPYYIGTLAVYERIGIDRPLFETIDGQQRLTTLCLLGAYFRKKSRGDFSWCRRECICFESRPHSSKTLKAIFEGKFLDDPSEVLQPAEINTAILNGYRLIQKILPQKLREAHVTPSAFADYLFDKVQVMRVRVPSDTDLNHYFEIMNNRGEQLEKHEVLKSKMMEVLNEADIDEAVKQRSLYCFHKIWEACANMERYVQMGFDSVQRNKIFGEKDWGSFDAQSFDELSEKLWVESTESANAQPQRLDEIIQPQRNSGKNVLAKKGTIEDAPERFNTVINFPNFLLQVLQVFNKEDEKGGIPLDDKRLISTFERYLLHHNDSLIRVKNFVYSLLKCKYLYDHYVIKREFAGGKDAWSLKRLNGGNQYVNTFGDEDSLVGNNRKILMLLSAFHVSMPTMGYKYWLNAALYHLYYADRIDADSYLGYLESVAKAFVFDRFLARDIAAEYYPMIYVNKGSCVTSDWAGVDESLLNFGQIANNLVFNYLDYLLWLKNREEHEKIRTYEFTFRSSVEHYYPQSPKVGHDRLPTKTLNSFGNLCLISHNKNSTLSNDPPELKKKHYKDGPIDSVKQFLMMQPERWTAEEIVKHYNEMVDVLKENLSSGVSIQEENGNSNA